MKQEDKELLLKDLCARLPYMPKIKITYQQQGIKGIDEGNVSCDIIEKIVNDLRNSVITDIQIYLRPMSSITEEEKEEIKPFFSKLVDDDDFGRRVLVVRQNKMALYQDWLNAHHFDYRGLIEKGLALKTPDGMYEINK